jgi:hypothetical protein
MGDLHTVQWKDTRKGHLAVFGSLIGKVDSPSLQEMSYPNLLARKNRRLYFLFPNPKYLPLPLPSD